MLGVPSESPAGVKFRMKNKKLKFGIGIGIILGVVAWQAISGF